MYCRTAAVSLGLLLLASCARQAAPPAVQRIAILRFENLGPEQSNDWMGTAFSEILARDLAGSPGVYAISTARLRAAGVSLGSRPLAAPGISAQRAAALASGARQIGYGNFSVIGGRLSANLTIEDAATGKLVRTFAVEVPAAGMIEAADRLAADILGNRPAPPYPTRNSTALAAYCRALETTNPAEATQYLEQAIAAEPDYLPPYRYLAELKAGQRDLPGARVLLEQALLRKSGDAVEAALIEADAARFRSDSAARLQAMGKLAKLTPLDPTTWRAVAEVAQSRREYRQAADALAKALEVEPEDAAVWNQYGYAAAYAGDLATATTALRRYQSMRPADPNPLDSLGDVHLLVGRLKEAESFYLEAGKKDPNFAAGTSLFKAALARLMTGDIAGADVLARQHLESRAAAKDPLAAYRAAEWDWVAGRRRRACAEMEAVARGASRDLASRAYAQLALWTLMLGDRANAASSSALALSNASQAAMLPAFVARFLAQPQAGADEWTDRAARAFPNAPNSIRDLTLLAALLIDRQFAAAAPILDRLESAGATSSDFDLGIVTAWTAIEAGKSNVAAPLLRWNPIPPAGGPGSYLSLQFPRIFYLRAIAAEKEGRAEEARSNYKLFLQLSGPDPLVWGEESKAKAAL